MEQFKGLQKSLYIWSTAKNLEKQVEELKAATGGVVQVESIHRLSIASYGNASFDLLAVENVQLTDAFGKLLQLLKPQGKLYLLSFVGSSESILQELKLSGFVNSTIIAGKSIISEKPGYEIGSAVKLSFGNKLSSCKPATAAVWKIGDDDAGDEDLIDADDLLDEEDKKKPDPETLRVCGTTGKRKACKDCSCGLAEELDAEKQNKTIETKNAKSSCGSLEQYDDISESTDMSSLLEDSIIEMDVASCSRVYDEDADRPPKKKRKVDTNEELLQLANKRYALQVEQGEQTKKLVTTLESIAAQNANFQKDLLEILRVKASK